MTAKPHDKQRAIELFEAAVEQTAGQRKAFLEAACRGQPALRAEVESLLAADQRATGFLEPPAPPVPPMQSADDPLLGTQLGKYRLQHVIAAGGMGTVYEALQEEPRRTVALKVMRPGLASRSALCRFKHESEILGRLRHPGIAQIYEAGTHGGEHGAPYFAMEYIPGARSITRYAAEQGLSSRQRLELFTHVCEAVHAGHQRGIIHRDLKPANILVDQHGQPKLIDFGVARATDADVTIATLQTDVGELVGTLRYMSPEQCEGDAVELDIRSDVYALGVVLFELLTGELPYDFSTASPFEVPRVIREQEPRRLSAINRTLRGDVEAIVLKALEKDRRRRYQSAAGLMRDIERYLRHEPIEAKRGRRWYVFRKALRRHRIAVAVVALFMLVVSASAVGLAVLYRDSTYERVIAERRAAELRHAVYLNDITLAQRAYEAGNGVELARRLAHCPPDLRGWEWHFFSRLADTSLQTLVGHTDNINALAVSPDGRLIASGDCDGLLCLWDSRSGQPAQTLQSEGFVEQISFSPDGRFLAYAGRDVHEAHVWNLETERPCDRLAIRTNFAVAFSPDGRHVAAGGFAYEPLRVWDWQTGQRRHEWPDALRTRPINIAWSPDARLLATARADGTVVLLDVDSGGVARTLTGHTADVRRVAFSPDGQQLASTSFDNTLRIWDVASGAQRHIFRRPGEMMGGVNFSPDGRRIVVGGASAVRVWDLTSGAGEAVRLGHRDYVCTVVFTPDGSRILSCSNDRVIKIWDAAPAAEPPILATSDHEYASIAVSPSGTTVAAGDIAGWLQILSMPDRAVLSTTHPHRGRILALAYSHEGGRLASAGDDGVVLIHGSPDEAPLLTLNVPDTNTRCLAWAPDDEWLISGHGDGTARIWAAASGRLRRTIHACEGEVYRVSLSRDPIRLFTAGNDRAVRVWNPDSGELLREILTGAAEMQQVAISPSGRLMATGAKDKYVRMWDLASGDLLWAVQGHGGFVTGLAFMPDGHRLITCGYHNLIRIWDVDTGEVTLTLRGHDAGVRAIAVSPDGRWFVSASIDKTLRLWTTIRRHTSTNSTAP